MQVSKGDRSLARSNWRNGSGGGGAAERVRRRSTDEAVEQIASELANQLR